MASATASHQDHEAAAATTSPEHISPTWVVACSLADVDAAIRLGGAPLRVRVPDGATVVPDEAFRGSALVQIVMPGSVTEIGRRAFDGCANLVSAAVPPSVHVVGKAAFRGCRSLGGICIPTGVTKIWGSTFEGCTSLADVSIPPTVAWVGERAFAGCAGLVRVTVPPSVAEIGPGAFEGCTSLPVAIESFVRAAPSNSADPASAGCSVAGRAIPRMQRALAALAADADPVTPEGVDNVPGAVVLRGCLSAAECDLLASEVRELHRSCSWDEGRRKTLTSDVTSQSISPTSGPAAVDPDAVLARRQSQYAGRGLDPPPRPRLLHHLARAFLSVGLAC